MSLTRQDGGVFVSERPNLIETFDFRLEKLNSILFQIYYQVSELISDQRSKTAPSSTIRTQTFTAPNVTTVFAGALIYSLH